MTESHKRFKLNAKLNIVNGTYKVSYNTVDSLIKNYDLFFTDLNTIKNSLNSIGNIDPYASKSKSYFAMFTIVRSIEETLKDFYDHKAELKNKLQSYLNSTTDLLKSFITESDQLRIDFFNDFIDETIETIDTYIDYKNVSSNIQKFINTFVESLNVYLNETKDLDINELTDELKTVQSIYNNFTYMDIIAGEAILNSYVLQLKIVKDNV